MSSPASKWFDGVHELRAFAGGGGLHPALDEIATTFQANYGRVREACRMPLEFGRWSRLHQRALDQLLLGQYGSLQAPGPAELLNAQTAANQAVEHQGLIASEEAMAEALEHLERRLLAGETERVIQGLQALLASTVVGAWSAVEVALGDTWEAAVNLQPNLLASRNPGTLMRTARVRFDFQSIHGIRDAYRAIFVKEQVRAAMKAEAFSELAATRNVIVHRTGLADQKFIEDRKKLKHPSISGVNVSLGMPVLFYGREVQWLCEMAGNAIFEVMSEVGRAMYEAEPPRP